MKIKEWMFFSVAQASRWLVTATMIGVILGVCQWFAEFVNSWVSVLFDKPVETPGTMFAVALGVLLGGVFIQQGVQKISADPPKKGVLTFFGMRIPVTLSEGFVWLPLYKLVFDVIEVEMTTMDEEFQITEGLITPDGVPHVAKIRILGRPNEKDRRGLIRHLQRGGIPGVGKFLDNILFGEFRRWFTSPDIGPQTTDKAVMATEEGINQLLKHLFQNGHCTGSTPYSSEDKAIEAFRKGKNDLKLLGYGFIIERLDITAIIPPKEILEARMLSKKEAEERKAQMLEAKHASKMMALLQRPLAEGGAGLTRDQANNYVRARLGGVAQDTSRREIDLSMAPEAAGVIEAILSKLMKKGVS